MRTLGSALAGALALSTAMPAHADPPGTKFSVSAAPAIVQPGTGSTSHPAPGFGGWHSAPAQMRQGNGVWVPAQNRPDGFRGPQRRWTGPFTVWGGAPYAPFYVPYVWGDPYVPYRYYGDWGALWYPYAEWRGPHGGWGNP